MPRLFLILATLLAGCSAAEPPSFDRRAPALELPPVGECTSLTGDVRLSGQDAVATFGARTCETINGDVLITQADDLSPLADLTTVTGALHIRQNAGTTLSGLDALTTVGELVIEDNPVLAAVSLPALTSADRIRVVGNPELTSLSADALPTADSLDLRALPALTDLSLAMLQLVVEECQVVGTRLTDLSGLGTLSSVGTLVVSNNDVLLDLDDLSTLNSVTEHLVIRQNDRLTSLSGLQNLTVVGGRVAITANLLLQNVSLPSIGTSDQLLIHRNPGLTTLSGLAAGYRAEMVHLAENSALSDLSNLPLMNSTDLHIRSNPALTSLDSIGAATIDNVYIRDNSGLGATVIPLAGARYIAFTGNSSTSLSFPALTGTTSLVIEKNGSLVSLSVDALASTDLYLSENLALQSVDFPVLTAADDFDVLANPLLATLNAPNLGSATDDFRVTDSALTDLSGFGSLQSVTDDFEILANPNMTDLAGMAALTSVNGWFNVAMNPSLVSLSALTSLSTVGDFTVQQNTSLPDCQATDLAAALTITGATTIMNNGGPAGCP